MTESAPEAHAGVSVVSAKIFGMFEIVVRTENGRRHVKVSADELAVLVRRIGERGDNFLIVQRIPDLPEVYIQVWHETGGDYTLEHRDGGPDRHFETTLGGPEPVITAIAGWAEARDGWGDALTWSLLDLGETVPPAPLDLSEQQLAHLEARVREVLVGGYTTRAELAETAEDCLATEGSRPISRAQAEALADRMWLDRVREQAEWEDETDPERLARAFRALDETGITARENFTCCRSCGLAEIGAEAPGARGFVFFHYQGTDSAAAGGGLSLYYGGFDDSEATTASVGREVVAALEEVGFSVGWNGDPGKAIMLSGLDWRKRLVG